MTETNKMRNKLFATQDKMFIECCEVAKVKPTPRQASKFRMGKGAAVRVKGEVIRHKLIEKGVINNGKED